MQYQPDAVTLLDAVGEVLEESVDTVPNELRHRVRVAAHVVRLVRRELELGADIESEMLRRLRGVIEEDLPTVASAEAAMAEEIRTTQDPVALDRWWGALVESTRRDLDIAKPGYSGWTGT